MFDMNEEDKSVMEPNKEMDIRIDDTYRAKLKAVVQCHVNNNKNTVDTAKQEKTEELRAGDYICYYYKPVSLVAIFHCVVWSCRRQESLL